MKNASSGIATFKLLKLKICIILKDKSTFKF